MKNGTEEAAIYRKKQLDQDFEENSYYESAFTPDREPSFHVNFDQIMLNETSQKTEKEYTLEYDVNLMESGNISLLSKLQNEFEKVGLDTANLTEDDKILNTKKAPSGEEEYHGTEGQKLVDINLDE